MCVRIVAGPGSSPGSSPGSKRCDRRHNNRTRFTLLIVSALYFNGSPTILALTSLVCKECGEAIHCEFSSVNSTLLVHTITVIRLYIAIEIRLLGQYANWCRANCNYGLPWIRAHWLSDRHSTVSAYRFWSPHRVQREKSQSFLNQCVLSSSRFAGRFSMELSLCNFVVYELVQTISMIVVPEIP